MTTHKVPPYQQTKEFFNRMGRMYDESRFRPLVIKRAALIKRHLLGERILDIGINCGLLMRLYSHKKKCVGMDIAFDCLALARKGNDEGNNRFLNADGHKIPLIDGCVDTVICADTLYYMASPDSFIKEAYRVLRPGGKLILISSNPIYCKIGCLIGPFLGLRPKDINRKTNSRGEMNKLLEAGGFVNIDSVFAGVVPFGGFEFLDRTPLRLLGFIVLVEGYKPLTTT